MILLEFENNVLQKTRRLKIVEEFRTDAYNNTVSISQRIVPKTVNSQNIFIIGWKK